MSKPQYHSPHKIQPHQPPEPLQSLPSAQSAHSAQSPQTEQSSPTQPRQPPVPELPLSEKDPYGLLRKMNRLIAEQKVQIEEYEIAMESLGREKEVLVGEKRRLEGVVGQLVGRLDMVRNQRNNENSIAKTSKISSSSATKTPTQSHIPHRYTYNYTSKNLNLTLPYSIPNPLTNPLTNPTPHPTKNLNLLKHKYLSPTTSKRLDTSNSNRAYGYGYGGNFIDQARSAVLELRDLGEGNVGSHNGTRRIEEIGGIGGPVEEEYVPQPIRLTTKSKNQPSSLSFININALTLENFNKNQYLYGQNLMETFTIVGPQISQFKKKRLTQKGKTQLTIKPASLYCYSKFYKQKKPQFIAQIAKRAFPQGCKYRKRLIEQSEQLLDIIDYKPNHTLSEDYFIFTLKGDQSLYKSSLENPAVKKSFLYVSNPNFFLFIVCLKLPDFVYIRDEKNYQRKENQVWIGEKIYAIATYYPFFYVHTEILCRVHEVMLRIMVRKILIDNQNIFTWNIAKTVYDVEKNQQISQILKYFSNKKPDYNQVCYTCNYYFGALPQFGYKSQYSISLYSSPIFFSNFSYQQMLLLLTSIFCQKTLIFLSSSQTKATLSALFLINLIAPFQYSYPLLLNCDSERVKEMIFEFPFAMICSVKRSEENLEEVLELFAESNVMRSVEDDAQYIVVDVDSNSILYHHVLDKLFIECIVQPDKSIRQAYLTVNPCQSKSFSLPRALPRQNIKPSTKPRSQLQKRKQQIKKSVKEYHQKITTNQTKLPTYRRTEKHQHLLHLLTDYVQSFTLAGEDNYEILNRLENCAKNARIEVVREYLLGRNKGRGGIIGRFLESQMYANYLDGIGKGV